MTESELDALLKSPLDEVADDGFSRAVATGIRRRAQFAIGLELGAVFVTFLLIVLFVPLGRIVAPLETLCIGLGLSLPFAVACAALALSHAGLRWFANDA